MSSSTSGGGGGGGGGYSKSTNTASPYQSQLYDSWKTEWGGTPAAYGYDQGQAGYRSGPGGSSGGEPDPYHSNKLERYRSVANLKERLNFTDISSYLGSLNCILSACTISQILFFIFFSDYWSSILPC